MTKKPPPLTKQQFEQAMRAGISLHLMEVPQIQKKLLDLGLEPDATAVYAAVMHVACMSAYLRAGGYDSSDFANLLVGMADFVTPEMLQEARAGKLGRIKLESQTVH